MLLPRGLGYADSRFRRRWEGQGRALHLCYASQLWTRALGWSWACGKQGERPGRLKSRARLRGRVSGDLSCLLSGFIAPLESTCLP